MSAHTPGPWITETSANLVQITDSAMEGHYIALVHLPNKLVPNSEATRAEYAANARLMAAAPELLAALEKVAHCSRYLPSQGDEMLYALEHLREIARAAIAKAGGAA